MAYRRFRHFGKDKVTMDFAFFAIAFNIKKLCAKRSEKGYDLLFNLIIKAYKLYFTHYRLPLKFTLQEIVKSQYKESNEVSICTEIYKKRLCRFDTPSYFFIVSFFLLISGTTSVYMELLHIVSRNTHKQKLLMVYHHNLILSGKM